MSFSNSFACAALVVASPLLLIGQNTISKNSGEPIAAVEDQAIYEQDLLAVAGQQLYDLRDQEYKLKRDALDKIIRKKVVEAEAKKRGITTDELWKQEVDSKIPEPSDEEAKGYFLAAQNQATLSFEALKPQVKQFIVNAEIQRARKVYEDKLRANTDIAILLQPPTVHVTYDPARVEGNPKAPITIVEFADYQCPFCKKSEETVKALLGKYDGKVKLAFLDFPLTEIHGQAGGSAEAARCALEQGKFWEYHDSLFADPSHLEEASLFARAKDLHLNESAFRSCLASGKFRDDIQANRLQGVEAGVTGTPAFFINGVFLSGAQPQEEFEKIIDTQLALPGIRKSAQ